MKLASIFFRTNGSIMEVQLEEKRKRSEKYLKRIPKAREKNSLTPRNMNANDITYS